MEYEKDKNKEHLPAGPMPLLKGVRKDIGPEEHSDLGVFENEAVSYNPYDYKDPSTQPKELNDGGPYVNNVGEIQNRFFLPCPSILKEEGGALHDWYKSRHEDWTSDPSQQNPAMSLDNRFASIAKSVVSRYLLNDTPIQTTVRVKTAASLLDIDSMFRSGDPSMHAKTVARANSVSGVTWQNRDNKDQITRGLYHFVVPSSSGKGSYDTYIQFLRTKNKKETPRGFLDFDVELSCSCDSFLFFGAQYYAVQGKYMYMPGFRPALLPPHPRTQTVSISRSVGTGPDQEVSERDNMGKGLNFRMCKHLLKALDFVKDNLRVEETSARKNYPLIGRPSYIINKNKWEEVFKFPFTLEEINKQLTTNLNKVPNFYRTVYTREKGHYDQVDQWVKGVFNTLPSSQRTAYLRFLVEHPEEIFYILWRHAADITPDKIDPILVSTGFRLMDRTIKSESDQTPDSAVKDTKNKNVYKGPNMTGPIQPDSMKAPGEEGDGTESEGKPDKPEWMKKKDKKEDKKFQPLKGKRISPAIKENLKNKRFDRGVRKTDLLNDI
jgi:hypothetical protein